MLDREGSQLGRGETVADTARVLSRYVDIIMLRTTKEEKLLELAEHATVPVINGLTDRTHPCQLMADVMTFEEHRGPIAGRTVAWCGDGNNMATSLDPGRGAVPTSSCASPARSRCRRRRTCSTGRESGGRQDHRDAIGRSGRPAPIASSPTPGSRWAIEPVADRHHNLLRPYQVDERLMATAKPDAIFMHCLPAHRGEEVTAGGHRRPAVGGVGRGREPPARAEGESSPGAWASSEMSKRIAAGDGRPRGRARPP